MSNDIVEVNKERQMEWGFYISILCQVFHAVDFEWITWP